MTTRRSFLQTGLAGGAALAGLSACGGGGGGSSSSSGGGNNGGGGGSNPPPAAPILVIVQIDGGNDWLSMAPPTSGANLAAYQSKRSSLRIDAASTTDLGSGIGLNKDTTGFDALQAAGLVAWIPGIGMPNPNLSHFTAKDIWGYGAATPDGTGWLGRWADKVFNASDVLKGVVVESIPPIMLKGHAQSFVSITGSTGFVYPSYLLRTDALAAANTLSTGWLQSLSTAGTDPVSLEAYAACSGSGKQFYDAQAQFNTLIKARTPSVPYPGEAAYPVKNLNGGNLTASLSNELKLIAQMIASDLPTQVYYARLGGWDTHSNQATDHPNLQRALGGAIKAFYDDLAAITTAAGPAQDRVLIATWSEFGRRVQENNGGTDHGTAALSFCVGKKLKGGLYGSGYPNLADLDANGNMKFTTDFRSLYATLLERWLGQSATVTDQILGANYPRLGFL